MEWRYIEESGQLAAEMESPRRQLTIAWDEGDRSLYLSVVAPPPPNVPSANARVYAAPLSLLAALLIVPRELHHHLTNVALDARHEAESAVLAKLGTTVDQLPQSWPAAAKARSALADASDLVQHVERLSLDMAAADAFEDQGTPV
jgi:hypothetical protein